MQRVRPHQRIHIPVKIVKIEYFAIFSSRVIKRIRIVMVFSLPKLFEFLHLVFQ